MPHSALRPSRPRSQGMGDKNSTRSRNDNQNRASRRKDRPQIILFTENVRGLKRDEDLEAALASVGQRGGLAACWQETWRSGALLTCLLLLGVASVAGDRYSLVCFCWACSVHRLVAGSCSYSWYWPRTYCIVIASTGPCIVIASTGPGPRVVGSSSQQRQLITYHVEFTEEEHPQPAPSPEHSLAYRRPTGGGR